MKTRKRKAPAKPESQSMHLPDMWPSDDILAPNSDTEGEPLPKRRKHIEEIAQFCRDGGDLYLISTSLRGPIVNNPWARRKLAVIEMIREKEEVAPRKGKKKLKATVKAAGTGKDGKVDQYFPAQKNSQEREAVLKKKKNPEKYAVEKEDPIICDTAEISRDDVQEPEDGKRGLRDESPAPFKAVPRIIDFDQIPQSTNIPSQNFPSLQLITPRRQLAQPPSIESDYIESNSSHVEERTTHTEEDGRLFDAPTPGKATIPKQLAVKPTERELRSIRDLIGEDPKTAPAPLAEDNEGLFDDPTPPHISNPSPTPVHPPSSNTILPPSLTVRYPPSFSPINAAPLKFPNTNHLNIQPLSQSPLSVFRNRQTSPTKKSPRKSKPLRRSSSLHNPVTIYPHRSLQRSQTHNPNPTTPVTPPLNTQYMLDLANQSFNAMLPQPLSPLLPAARLAEKQPQPSLMGFTPFRELNASPVPDGVSFKLSSSHGSPLTYSPGDPGVEELLWGEVKGFLGTWNLDEEVLKYKNVVNSNEETVIGKDDEKSANQSQECLVGAC